MFSFHKGDGDYYLSSTVKVSTSVPLAPWFPRCSRGKLKKKTIPTFLRLLSFYFILNQREESNQEEPDYLWFIQAPVGLWLWWPDFGYVLLLARGDAERLVDSVKAGLPGLESLREVYLFVIVVWCFSSSLKDLIALPFWPWLPMTQLLRKAEAS